MKEIEDSKMEIKESFDMAGSHGQKGSKRMMTKDEWKRWVEAQDKKWLKEKELIEIQKQEKKEEEERERRRKLEEEKKESEQRELFDEWYKNFEKEKQ